MKNTANRHRVARAMLLVATVLAAGPLARAADALRTDPLNVQRKDVFEFTEKPQVTRQGDKVTITFASKDFCDATVAIENAEGKIIRHLVSGVLGPNAPAPFQKSSLRQTLVWDGKNDKEEYVDDKDTHTARVSLGLKAQFERTLFWSPKKKASRGSIHLVRAAPEGVYVAFPGEETQIRLFDHDANYVRTVFPFPAGQLDHVAGLPRKECPPDGRPFPLKQGAYRLSLLPGGVMDLEVAGDWSYLVGDQLMRLATDGSSGGRPFYGPDLTCVTNASRDYFRQRPGPLPIPPLSAAMSPDGKWLYLAGYGFGFIGGDQFGHSRMLHGVMRVDPNGDGKAQMFAGDMEKAGTDDSHFDMPRAVTCDRNGRVFVADHNNDRIQVFTPDGKLQKSIPVWKPTVMRIDPKTGELYVFSWRVGANFGGGQEKWDAQNPKRPHSLTVLASPDDPAVRAAYPLDLPGPLWSSDRGGMSGAYADVDFWTPTGAPRVWLVSDVAADSRSGTMALRVFDLKDRRLVLVHDFEQETAREIVRANPPGHSRWRLYCNPRTGKVYIGEDHFPAAIVVKGFSNLVELDPNTGKVRIVEIPFDSEDMAFDIDGHAYLRTFDQIARFDSGTWREVPFDYGEEFGQIGYQGLKTCKVSSAVVFAGGGNASSQLGGIWVSPKGHVAVHTCNPNAPTYRAPTGKGTAELHKMDVKRYEVPIFPGRAVSTVMHVFDRHGKVLYEDALPGVGFTEGIAMDKDDNLYLMAVGLSNHEGKPYPDPQSCTLVKLRPKTVVLGRGIIPLSDAARPKRAVDLHAWRDAGSAWIEGVHWTFGGVGFDTQGEGRGHCHCVGNSRFTLDYFARSFAPELPRYGVVVVDSAGNAIIRIGRYGSVDDGLPLVKAGPSTGSGQTAPPTPRSIGGDEVALLTPRFVATHTDRRLFIGDRGNERVLAVKLGYHTEVKVPLKDVPDRTQK